MKQINPTMSSRLEALAQKIVEGSGRVIGSVIHIEGTGEDFDINTRAEHRCRELGFAIGSMCRDEPRGLAKAHEISHIAKWRNISRQDWCQLDGVLLSDDFRCGRDAYIVLFEDKGWGHGNS